MGSQSPAHPQRPEAREVSTSKATCGRRRELGCLLTITVPIGFQSADRISPNVDPFSHCEDANRNDPYNDD